MAYWHVLVIAMLYETELLLNCKFRRIQIYAHRYFALDFIPMKEHTPLVSIIIVNYNGKDLIERCLSSVTNTNYPNYEIIVVDNNSTDDSITVIREKFPSCRVILLSDNMGFAIANNIGAKNAKGDYYVFLNNDTYVTPEWLHELVSVMESDNDIAISQSLLLNPDGSIDSSGDFITKNGRTYSSKRLHFNGHRDILSARGASMMVRKDFYRRIGGFDEDYFISFEDVELGWKAWILGYRVIMVPTSVVLHYAGSTTVKMNEMMVFNGLKNQLSLITTHFETTLAIKNILWIGSFLFLSLIKVLLGIGKYERRSVIQKRAAISGVYWYVRNFRKIWRKHANISRERKRLTVDLCRLNLITDNMYDN